MLLGCAGSLGLGCTQGRGQGTAVRYVPRASSTSVSSSSSSSSSAVLVSGMGTRAVLDSPGCAASGEQDPNWFALYSTSTVETLCSLPGLFMPALYASTTRCGHYSV